MADKQKPKLLVKPAAKSPARKPARQPAKPDKRFGSFEKLAIVALLAAFAFGVFLKNRAAFESSTGDARVESGPISAEEQIAANLLFNDDSLRLAQANWTNERPGFFSRLFRKLCLGYSKSESCGDEAEHPFKSVAEALNLPLTFPKETDRKVIEQTLEYNSRGSFKR